MKTAFSVTSPNIPHYDGLRFIFTVVWQWTESHQVTTMHTTTTTTLYYYYNYYYPMYHMTIAYSSSLLLSSNGLIVNR